MVPSDLPLPLSCRFDRPLHAPLRSLSAALLLRLLHARTHPAFTRREEWFSTKAYHTHKNSMSGGRERAERACGQRVVYCRHDVESPAFMGLAVADCCMAGVARAAVVCDAVCDGVLMCVVLA